MLPIIFVLKQWSNVSKRQLGLPVSHRTAMEVLMKISNNNGFETYPLGFGEISSVNKTAKQEEIKLAPSMQGQDTVSLSEDAKYHTIAKTEALNAPDVRAEKVARLKAMIANGTYEFNSMDTARAMVKDMFADRELLLMN